MRNTCFAKLRTTSNKPYTSFFIFGKKLHGCEGCFARDVSCKATFAQYLLRTKGYYAKFQQPLLRKLLCTIFASHDTRNHGCVYQRRENKCFVLTTIIARLVFLLGIFYPVQGKGHYLHFTKCR